MTKGFERKMLHVRLDQALNERRHAHFKRRCGDAAGFKWGMEDARFYLLMARQWKPKVSHPNLAALPLTYPKIEAMEAAE